MLIAYTECNQPLKLPKKDFIFCCNRLQIMNKKSHRNKFYGLIAFTLKEMGIPQIKTQLYK